MALATAPLPRPPQPIKASRMVLSSPASTCGMATPAKAEAAANPDGTLDELTTGCDAIGRLVHGRSLLWVSVSGLRSRLATAHILTDPQMDCHVAVD